MKKVICFFIIVCLICPTLNVYAVANSAKAAILINADTGEVIYEHNADERLPMASTTKIMTGLLLCENGELQKEITVTEQMIRVEGSSMGLLAGDKVTLHDLLYGLMLASGNDAANVIAYVLGGTINGFVKKMNNKADELGLNNTNFVTPSGLDAEEHYTSARDLANLTRIALQNEDFAAAVSSKSAVLNYGNPPYRRTLTNHNKLLKSFDGAIGVKTGFTKKSGRCLVSAAERDGKRIIAVTLKDPNDWSDHKELLEYGLSKINITEIKPDVQNYKIPVISGEEAAIAVDIEPFVFSSLSQENFSCTVNLPKFLYAPIEKGEVIGSVIYKSKDNVIEEIDIKAEKQVLKVNLKVSIWEKIKENYKYIFANIWEK